MTGSDLAKTLMTAWRKDNQGKAHDLQEPGENTLRVISSALNQEDVQGMLQQALAEGMDFHHATLVNQEAERQAGLWLWDPEQTGKMDRECLLLACPVIGDLKALEAWMATPGNQEELEALAHRHLELLSGLEGEDVEAVALFPFLLHPVMVANLTAEARRKVLMETLGRGDRQVLAQLKNQALKLDEIAGDQIIGEAIVLMAAVVKTRWGWHQPEALQDVADPHRVDDLALGKMDEDFMTQAQSVWEDGLMALQPAGPAALRQPVSVNQALLSTLHSSLVNIRRHVLSPVDPTGPVKEWEGMGGPGTPIVQLAIQEGDPGHIQLDIKTLHAQTIVQIPTPWAFVEGEDAFRHILVQTMDLDEYDWQSQEQESEGQAAQNAKDAQGDHPAWKRAMPAPDSRH